ncbi:MAG: AEC family transporter [Nitrincola lacisaponensis]|uniref:AEC family transporter n=1 Tax=Nitrincola lacisaponensis TaxID=267850 RepID=UPI003918A2D3
MEVTSWMVVERIFQTIFPLLAIVLIGFLYARKRPTDMSVANKVNIDIFTPALIFSVMSAESFDLPSYYPLAFAALLIIILSGILIWPLCRLIGVQPKTFLPPMMFSNSGNLGIPLIVLAFGEAALPAAVVLFLVENLLHFTLGLYILDNKTRLLHLLRMPMILATLAGVAWSYTDWVLPAPLRTFVDMLGQIAIPLMLFALGVRMTSIDFTHWKIGVWGAILAPVTGLLIALSLQPLLQLEPQHFAYLLVFAALPPAVLNYMVSERYNQEPHLVAAIVLIGNVGSLAFIPLVLAFTL